MGQYSFNLIPASSESLMGRLRVRSCHLACLFLLSCAFNAVPLALIAAEPTTDSIDPTWVEALESTQVGAAVLS